MTCTYRFYDASDGLLYVGVADDFDARWKGHQKKPWWPDVARKEVIWFDNRLDALYEESRAIDLEHPLHNRKAGMSPIGLRLIRYWRRGKLVYGDWAISATRIDKEKALRAVCDRGAHAWLTYEGEDKAIVIPVDWYERACAKMGHPVDLGAQPQLDWAEI
ncbi:GIY-YIG nuclease family protein [Micromonospora echinospora]|uniref:GIY-YIG nuclease family protein n=1 Tax=Micromonospora echinospora TaxID=1877 RepID=UPI00378DD27B